MENHLPNRYEHPDQLPPVATLNSPSAPRQVTLPGISSLLSERSFSQDSDYKHFTQRPASSFSTIRAGSTSPRPTTADSFRPRRPSSAASPLAKRSIVHSPPASTKIPHWSNMDYRKAFLPTPPTSGDNIKPSDSFSDVHESQDALFQTSEREPTHYSPLFHSPPQRATTRPSEHWDSKWSPESQETFDDEDEDDYQYSTPSPLLTRAEVDDLRQTNGYVHAIRQHMQSTFGDWKARGILPPTEEEYLLVMNSLNSLRLKFVDSNSSAPAAKKRKVLEDTSANRRSYTSLAPKSAKMKKHSSTDPKTGAIRHRRTTKPTEKNANGENKSARAKSSKAAFSKNYLDYPDYAPDWALARNPENLKSVVKTWPGHVDIYTDPLRHEMTEYELKAAEALSLDCAKYLCLKRQLFTKYVEILRRRHQGEKTENWNRTAAQNATNIDVNKVSQVFNWFDSMGLFNESYFQRFMNQES